MGNLTATQPVTNIVRNVLKKIKIVCFHYVSEASSAFAFPFFKTAPRGVYIVHDKITRLMFYSIVQNESRFAPYK